MAKLSPSGQTTMSAFGSTYDLNAINKMAVSLGIKPLTPKQIKSMSRVEINRYLRAGKRAGIATTKVVKKSGKEFRKNAQAVMSENYKQAQLMHGTIRQALGEAGTLGAQALATNAISRGTQASSAIQQNTDGGTVPQKGDNEDSTLTEHGPVYSYKGRKED